MTSKAQAIKQKVVSSTVRSKERKAPSRAKSSINTTAIGPFPMVSAKTILKKSTLVYHEIFLPVIFRMLAKHG